MAGHEKMYAICENKCFVEVWDQSPAYGVGGNKLEIISKKENLTTYRFSSQVNPTWNENKSYYDGSINFPAEHTPDKIHSVDDCYVIATHNSIHALNPAILGAEKLPASIEFPKWIRFRQPIPIDKGGFICKVVVVYTVKED